MRDNVTRYTYILWRYATIDTSNEQKDTEEIWQEHRKTSKD